MTALNSGRAAFVLSVDLPPIRAIGPTGGLSELLKVITGFGFSATWYSPDPAGSVDVDRVLAITPAQEVGVSGDAAWATTGVGRNLFLRELSRRVSRAAAAGYSIASLSVPEQGALDHLDLAARHGIDSVRVIPASAPRSLLTRSLSVLTGAGAHIADGPRLVRYGLWQVPVTIRFPQRDRFSLSGVARQAVRAIDQATNGGYLHLVIDLSLATDARISAAKTVETILAAARARQEQGRLAALNVRQLVHRLAQQNRSVPAQSFLRRRAA